MGSSRPLISSRGGASPVLGAERDTSAISTEKLLVFFKGQENTRQPSQKKLSEEGTVPSRRGKKGMHSYQSGKHALQSIKKTVNPRLAGL